MKIPYLHIIMEDYAGIAFILSKLMFVVVEITKGEINVLKIPLISFLFQGLPEAIASVALSFAILKQAFKWDLIIMVGAVYGIVIFLIRMLPISFGVHAIINVIILTMLLIKNINSRLPAIFFASLLNIIVVGIAEFIFNELILMFLNISFAEAYANKVLWIVLGVPQVFFVLGIALIINKFNKSKESTAL